MKAWKHFKTITNHKIKVMLLCFRFGLIKQGLLHDLSKYSPTEFMTGVKYYQGDKSPNSAEREKIGYSKAWLHHKGRNRHHWEYWVDMTSKGVVAAPMPIKYVVEMFCDRVSATKVYQGKDYSDQAPLAYYNRTRHYYVINEETDKILLDMLQHLANTNLDETIIYIKQKYLNKG